MKTTAIICEYNPYHKGHELQIKGIKNNADDNAVVCIMSGGYVQRGQPATYDKYVRAEAAIKCGADLVVELPYPYSCSAAEFFAFGGVCLAESLGVVDELCFGSECGSIETLEKVSERIKSDIFLEEMSRARENGQNKEIPFAKLRETVYKNMYGDEFPVTPNDILGVEYVSALKNIGSRIIPVTYKREKGFSATGARALLADGNYSFIPKNVIPVFEKADRYSFEKAETAVLAFYRNADAKELEKYEGMTNGIADRLIKCARESTSLAELLEKMSGKSYTNARIRRCILNGMNGVRTDMLKKMPKYTQVLGMNGVGKALLKDIRKKGSISVLTKPSHYKRLDGDALLQAEFSVRSDNLLTLMCERTQASGEFLKKSPYVQDR